MHEDPKVQRVIEAGRHYGIEVVPVSFGSETRTAEDAARAVGCRVSQIVKSLVFTSERGPVLILVSGTNRVNERRAAEVVGVERLERADAHSAKAITGYAIGATPPLGLVSQAKVLMDEDLMRHDEVWAAAGRPDTVFCVDPHKLARAANATVDRIAE